MHDTQYDTPVVLVVEDDPMLSLNATTIVEDAGFVVVRARDAETAVDILLQRADIRIVFADLDVPGSMKGLDFAASIRDRWPPIDLILTSSRVAVSIDALPARAVFVAKPYRPDQITILLHRFEDRASAD